jgi:hypothetical protein
VTTGALGGAATGGGLFARAVAMQLVSSGVGVQSHEPSGWRSHFAVP